MMNSMKINFEKKHFREIAARLKDHNIRHGPIHRTGDTYSCQLLDNYNQSLFSYLMLCDKVQILANDEL